MLPLKSSRPQTYAAVQNALNQITDAQIAKIQKIYGRSGINNFKDDRHPEKYLRVFLLIAQAWETGIL